MKNVIIFITASSKEEARRIASYLVKAKLVACVNIVHNIESVFTWKNKVETAKEVLLIAKTKSQLFSKLESAVRKLHSYECPEIIAFEITKGNKDYLKWLKDTTL